MGVGHISPASHVAPLKERENGGVRTIDRNAKLNIIFDPYLVMNGKIAIQNQLGKKIVVDGGFQGTNGKVYNKHYYEANVETRGRRDRQGTFRFLQLAACVPDFTIHHSEHNLSLEDIII